MFPLTVVYLLSIYLCMKRYLISGSVFFCSLVKIVSFGQMSLLRSNKALLFFNRLLKVCSVIVHPSYIPVARTSGTQYSPKTAKAIKVTYITTIAVSFLVIVQFPLVLQTTQMRIHMFFFIVL